MPSNFEKILGYIRVQIELQVRGVIDVKMTSAEPTEVWNITWTGYRFKENGNKEFLSFVRFSSRTEIENARDLDSISAAFVEDLRKATKDLEIGFDLLRKKENRNGEKSTSIN